MQGCNLAVPGNFGGGNEGLPGIALLGIGSPAVPALIDELTGPPPKMMACVANTLGAIGPPAKAAVPVLVQALRVATPRLDNAEAVCRYAIIALGRIGPDAKAAVPAMNALLDLDDAGKLDPDHGGLPVIEAFGRIDEPPIGMLVDAFSRDDRAFGTDDDPLKC